MKNNNKVPNSKLLQAGLKLMHQNNKALTKVPSLGRSRLFELPNGDTVRARTCNDHILVVVADSPDQDARLNIEGTDWLLIVMPEKPRSYGKIMAYLVPAEEAVEEVRRTYRKWLRSNPNTRGSNTTWNLSFKDGGFGDNYAKTWAKYLLEGDVSTLDDDAIDEAVVQNQGGNINAAVASAREHLARVAGVSPQAVKISIDFAE